MSKEKRAEILAPVGNTEMLYAAVRSGADAVYLGAKDFSARRNAENFDRESLKEAVSYCHIRGVRVYLTLNIMIKEQELASAFELARDAYNAGVDGIIISDIGLARALKQRIPEIKLHGSTQMSVHSPSALPLLKEMGFCQVVVAREMSREELKVFCKEAKRLEITVEVFVHGALCMCLSGQCLLSAFLGSRSGNRGLCAGPCRLPFAAEGGNGYDLSLKDLSLLDYIRELSEMGVGSFKIEGRMKRPEYVAAATAACRQALDKGAVESELAETLKGVFSRSGFTAGYYENRLGKDMFGIRTKEDVLSADSVFPRLHEMYRAERKSVEVGLRARIQKNCPMSLTLSDNEGNTVTVEGSVPQAAQNKPLSYENAIKNLSKFGGTPYENTGGGLSLDDGLFVPAGELNELRRRAVEALDNARSSVKIKPSDAEYEPIKAEGFLLGEKRELYVRVESKAQIPENLSGIAALILPLELEPQGIGEYGVPVIADIPRGIISEQVIEKRLQLFKAEGCVMALCGNLAAVEIALRNGFEVIADAGLNIANSETVSQLKEFGVKGAVLSAETELTALMQVKSQIPTGIIAYGNIPLMVFRNCPLKNGISCADCDKNGVITDRLGTRFPVRCRMGYSELLNSVPIWLADRKAELSADFLVLYFTREEKTRVAQVIEAYKSGASSDIKHTRGLYYRGVL